MEQADYSDNEESVSDINLSKKIELKKKEIQMMKDIINKQLENLQELQMKYEGENILLKQMPKNQQIATERYEEALEIATNLQLKQCEINQILENSFEQYDHTSQLIDSANENFEGEKTVGKQRMLVYEADIAEMKQIGEITLLKMNKRINDKKLLFELAKNNLSKYNCDVEIKRLETLEQEINGLKLKKNELNGLIIKLQEDIKQSVEKKDLLEQSFTEQKQKALNKIEELNERTKKEEESLLESEFQIKKLKIMKEELLENIAKIRQETAIEEQNIILLKQDIQNKDTEMEELTMKLNKLKMDLPDLQSVSELKASLKMKQETITNLEHEMQQLEEKLKSNEEMQANLQIKYNTLIEDGLNKERELNDAIKFREQLEQKISSVRDEIELVNMDIQNNEKYFEEIQKELSNRINQLTMEDSEVVAKITKLENDIKIKKDMTEKLKLEVSMKKTEFLEKSNKIEQMEQELEEKDQYIEEETGKYKKMCSEIKEKIENQENHIEQVKNIKSEINRLREATEKCKEELKEKCEEVTNIYNKKIDAKLKEFEDLKKALSIDEEKYNDEKSKIDFQYYTLKNNHRCRVDQYNQMSSLISRCKGEKVIMDSYMNWVTKKASILLTKCKPEMADETNEVEEAKNRSVEAQEEGNDVEPEASNYQTDDVSSLDIPEEKVTSKEAVTPTVPSSSTSKVPKIAEDVPYVITIESSDSDATVAANKLNAMKKKPLFFDNVRVPRPIKTMTGRKRKVQSKPVKAPNKVKPKKSILDLVIESDSN